MKHYPLYQQFIDRKGEWIGGELICSDSSSGDASTTITDISLEEVGDSAVFQIHGKDFDCSYNVKYGGVTGSDKQGYLMFSTFFGMDFYIKRP